MNLQNTHASEDRAIAKARMVDSTICDLIETIERLDAELERWKEVSGCDGPDELREKMEDEKLESAEFGN